MNRNCIQFVLLSLVFVLTGMAGAADFAGGTGEPNDPYQIATAEQLLGANFDQPGVYYKLCCDIDLAGLRVFLFRFDFEGHLDGDGYAIRHARIEPEWHHQGFFKLVRREATISNLTLADFTITVPETDDTTQIDYVGGLVAENYGTITNCRATGWIVAHGGGRHIGGLVGVNREPSSPGGASNGVITRCCFEGAISSDGEGVYGLGGLAGTNRGVIANCYATGAVSGKTNVGGLVGSNDGSGSITNCHATTTVFAERGGGGLVGRNVASLTRCYASGLVTGELRGGLIGMEGTYAGTVTACLWDTYATNCETSGGGLAMGLAQRWNPQTYAANGWAGDPNWVMEPFADYPRLAWEGTEGEPIPEPQAWSFVGSGTEEDPYQIESVDQLAELARSSILWDQHFVLVSDLDLSGWSTSQWRPIGICEGSAFSGTFDGQEHEIVCLSVCRDGVPAWNLGLFGYVTGHVRNLYLDDVVLDTGLNSQRIGLLAGTCNGGFIENCNTWGSIETGMNSCRVGLLVGMCDAGLIEGCNTSGSVRVGANSESVGELVGQNTGEIVDCTANGTVTAGEGSTGIGGLIGVDGRR